MLHSNYRFKAENGRLNIAEDFINKDDLSIRTHNKLIGFILWLIGKAEFIEAKDEKGIVRIWSINKNSCDKHFNGLAYKYPTVERFFEDSIDQFITRVKNHIEQEKKAKNKENPKEDKNPPKVEKPVIPHRKKEDVAPKENPQPVQPVIPAQEQNPLVLSAEKAKEFIENANDRSLDWTDETLMKLQNLESLPIIKFKNFSPILLDTILKFNHLKRLEVDFSKLLTQEIDALFDLQHRANIPSISFSTFPDIKFYEDKAEKFELYSKMFLFFAPVSFLHDLNEKINGLREYSEQRKTFKEFYTSCLEKFKAHGDLEAFEVNALSDENQKKLFACIISNNNNQAVDHLKKWGEVYQEAPLKLFNFLDLVQENLNDRLNHRELSTAYILSLVNVGGFDEAFLNALTADQQQAFIKFMTSNNFHALPAALWERRDPKVMERLFAGCMHLAYVINKDPDIGVIFFVNIQHIKAFAPFFFSLKEEQFLAIETCFKTFKNPNNINDRRIDREPLTQAFRTKTVFLQFLANILNNFIKHNNKDFELFKGLVIKLNQTFPWITLEDISKIYHKKEEVLAYYMAHTAIAKLQNGDAAFEIAKIITPFFGLKGDPIRNLLPPLLFKGAAVQPVKVLELYEGYEEMAMYHLCSVIAANDSEIIANVFDKFCDIHKKLSFGYPGVFPLLLKEINTKEHLLILLQALKYKNLPEKKILYQGIAGGFSNFDFGFIREYKSPLSPEIIQEVFKEADLEEQYINQPVACNKIFEA